MSGKKFGIYYNQEFNVYMVALTPDRPTTSVEKQDNVFVLKNGPEIVGFNIFPTQKKHQPATTFCSEMPNIVSYVERKVKPYMALTQEPQFLIAKILSATPIPGTHLYRCDLDIARKESIQVVTGAQNIVNGQYSVLATNGAWMPNSQVISAKKMQGYDTKGMLCSARELHLSTPDFNHSGIINLPSMYHSHLGQSFWKVYYGAHKA